MGTIGGLTGPSADTWSNGITHPIRSFVPNFAGAKHGSRLSLPEPRPPSTPECPSRGLPGGTQEVTSDADGIVLESNTLAYDNPTLDQSHIEGKSPSATSDQNDFHNKEVAQFSDPGTGDGGATRLSVGLPAAGTRNCGSQQSLGQGSSRFASLFWRHSLPSPVSMMSESEVTHVSIVAIRLKYPERN